MSNMNDKPVERDWRFAELVARSWMEPELAVRYAADPCGVLAEFGLKVARREDAPSLEPYCGPDLIIEDLEHARGQRLNGGCVCWSEPGGGVEFTQVAGTEPAKEPSA